MGTDIHYVLERRGLKQPKGWYAIATSANAPAQGRFYAFYAQLAGVRGDPIGDEPDGVKGWPEGDISDGAIKLRERWSLDAHNFGHATPEQIMRAYKIANPGYTYSFAKLVGISEYRYKPELFEYRVLYFFDC